MFQKIKVYLSLTKAQRRARSKAIGHANRQALKQYFTGDGAQRRIGSFLWRVLIHSSGWLAKTILMASWAVIAGLLVGPENQTFLAMLRDWMIATPFDQVALQTHAAVLSGFLMCVQLSVFLGVGQALLGVLDGADKEARALFNGKLSHEV